MVLRTERMCTRTSERLAQRDGEYVKLCSGESHAYHRPVCRYVAVEGRWEHGCAIHGRGEKNRPVINAL
jgi:hypothetical protein